MSPAWRRGDVTWRAIPGFLTICSPADDRAASWAGAAALIWDLLDHPHTAEQLVEVAAALIDVDHDALADAVNALLDEWQRMRFVVEVPGGS